MSNVRELAGDLHPEGAGALGFVEPGLGRLVFEVCWTPSGHLLRGKLHEAVVELVLPEIGRQTKQLVEAHLDVQLAEAALAWSRAPKPEQRMAVDRARGRLGALRAQAWPRTTLESLPALTVAAVREIALKNHCACCEGRGQVLVGDLLTPCAACNSRGVVPMSDRKRAQAIGKNESVYRRHWRHAYEWLHAHLWDAEQQAARETVAALMEGAAVTQPQSVG